MATKKMRLRHAFRTGGDDLVEELYGVRLIKDDKNLHRQIDQVLTEHEETMKALTEEEKSTDEKELLEKMEYFETLDINQLRSILKSSSNIPHKSIIKMNKEQIISELLR
jgi:hypothetical protein